MRLLADENIPGRVVEVLVQKGHDLLWVRERFPGISDTAVLKLAEAEDRSILTFDKDFGELAFRHGMPAACGIVLFRIPPSPDRIAEVVVRAIESISDIRGLFVIVEEGRIRIRELPGS